MDYPLVQFTFMLTCILFQLLRLANAQSGDGTLNIKWTRPKVIQTGPDYTGFVNTPASFLALHKLVTFSVCNGAGTQKNDYSVKYQWTVSRAMAAKDVQTTTAAPEESEDGGSHEKEEHEEAADEGSNQQENSYQVMDQVATFTATSCQAQWHAPWEGPFYVAVDMIQDGNVKASGSNIIQVKDIWIVAMGDSFISGQGCPDQAQALFGIKPAKWIDSKCYRSAQSFAYYNYKQIAKAYPDRAVLFTYIPCSGASLQTGVIGKYLGEKSQLEVLQDIQKKVKEDCKACPTCCKTAPDVLLISIGGNDIKFSEIMLSLLQGNPADQLSAMPQRLDALKDRLQALRDALESLGITPQSVFYMEYFDLLKNSAGYADATCGGFGLSNSETIDLAETQIRKPVNDLLKQTAAQNGWTYVSGVDAIFSKRGVCSKDSYITSVATSLQLQGDVNGGYHPNYVGHQAVGALLWNSYLESYLNDNLY